MADHALFYNSVDHDRVYNADSFSDWLKKFFTTGVFTGDLFVSALTGMNVSVGTGYVNIKGKVMIYDTTTQLTLDPANGIYPRIDTIVVERNDTDRDFYLKVVTGDYANLNDPVPTPPVRSGAIYQLVLAQIYVGAGVTEITQANITDTRPDDDLCGLVTGTVTEMDFSQFAAQFAAYYQEFKNGYEADFENWSDDQRANFTAWMSDEKDEFDTWFANLHYVLDGDVAGHLQNEIDALAAGMTGSIFEIQTSEPTLIGQTVTVTGPTKSMTATISNAGTAEIRGFDEVGTITISATDGDEIATTVVSIPYFGNYPITLAFWSATVNIQGDENIYGEDVLVSNSQHILVDTVTLSAVDGTGTFVATKADTYTFTATYSGETYTETLAVTEQTTYSLSIETTPNGSTATPNDIQTWLKCAGITNKSYTTLAEVLEDEETFDILLRDSNACDYMARSTDWAVAEGKVPIMTSNTTPSGVASASSEYNSTYAAWKAFDGDEISGWNASTSDNVNNAYLGYTFTSPIVIRQVRLVTPADLSYTRISAFKLQGYDGSNWVDIGSEITRGDGDTSYIFDNETAYIGYRIRITGTGTNAFANGAVVVRVLQFFEHVDITHNEDAMRRIGKYSYCKNQLLNNEDWLEAVCESPYAKDVFDAYVPKMTSNTAPSGEAFAAQYTSGNNPWMAFDENDNTLCNPNPSNGVAYCGYQFASRTKVNFIYLKNYINANTVKTFKIQAINNGGSEWIDLTDVLTNTADGIAGGSSSYKIDNNDAYDQYRMLVLSKSGEYANIAELQFYGVKEAQTDIIHSAPQDTVYYMEDGEPVVLCTTDANGVGTVDWSDFDAGDITLYSTVAKDPDNLSNDYSKTIKITKSSFGGTTEAYLMPDVIRTLYWYGYVGEELTSSGWVYANITTSQNAPTYNTNDITLTCTANSSNASFIGTSSTKHLSKVCAIGYANTTSTMSKGGIGVGTTKDAVSNEVQLPLNTAGYIEKSMTEGDYYVSIHTYYVSTSTKFNALWYEKASA